METKSSMSLRYLSFISAIMVAILIAPVTVVAELKQSNSFKMPDLNSMNYKEAIQKLDTWDLQLTIYHTNSGESGSVSYAETKSLEEVEDNIVVRDQYPNPGSIVKRGSKVRLYIGPEFTFSQKLRRFFAEKVILPIESIFSGL